MTYNLGLFFYKMTYNLGQMKYYFVHYFQHINKTNIIKVWMCYDNIIALFNLCAKILNYNHFKRGE